MLRVTITAAVAMLAVSGTGASAQQPANSGASCVALITSYEASQLASGFVGQEVSTFATSGPGLGTVLVAPLANAHLGSVESSLAAEG